MKTQISRWSDDPAKRRSGIYQQQGRMITDADLNELMELLKRRIDEALGDVVGSGVPRSAGGVIEPGPLIKRSTIYVDGIRARFEGPPGFPGSVGFGLSEQADFPSPPAYPAGDQILYVDVWEWPTTALQDPSLLDAGLHGADTATRTKTLAQVKWCPAAVDPMTDPRNPGKGNALLSAALHESTNEADPCDPCAQEIALEGHVGNYLFRLEVHDVQGPAHAPTEITLKWSAENGAEQHAQADVPVEFTRGDWIYEFYSDTTEKHLGVHLTPGFSPTRAILKDGWPTVANLPDASLLPNVRRWDGYTVLTKIGGSWSIKSVANVLQAKDKGRVFVPRPAEGAARHGDYVLLEDGTFLWELSALSLALSGGGSFVAGDFWLLTVREAAGIDSLLGDLRVQPANSRPIGITHHYAVLARTNGANVQALSDADIRRLSFPKLTNLTADRVGYDATAQLSRWTDVIDDNTVAAPLNVQRAIDLLVEKLDSSDISYAVTSCGSTSNPTVRSLLGISSGTQKVDSILTKLLCDLKSTALPIDKAAAGLPPMLNVPDVTTVQQALNVLAASLTGQVCEATVGPGGQYPTLSDAFTALASANDISLCLLPGVQSLSSDITVTGKRTIKLTGVGVYASKVTLGGKLRLVANEINLRDIAMMGQDAGHLVLEADRVTVRNSGFARAFVWTSHPWAKRFGGSLSDKGMNVAVDPAGNTFVTGYFIGTVDFDGTSISGGGVFVVKIGVAGNLIWAKGFGGGSTNQGLGIAVDTANDVVVTGFFGTAFSVGSTNLSPSGPADMFVFKLDSNGGPKWAKRFSGSLSDQRNPVAIDASRNIVLTGSFSGSVSFGGDTFFANAGNTGAFLLQLDPQGLHRWSKGFSTTTPDEESLDSGAAVAIDSNNDILWIGNFSQTLSLGGSILSGNPGIFVAKFKSSAGEHVWSQRITGSGTLRRGRSIAVDASRNLFLTGQFKGDLQSDVGTLATSDGDNADVFLMKLDASGALVWCKNFGGTSDDQGLSVAVDASGNVLLTGYFNAIANFGGDNFPGTGANDIFVAKYDPAGRHVWSRWFGGTSSTSNDQGCGVAVHGNGDVVLTGFFGQTVNFGGGPLTTAGTDDIFVARLATEPVLNPLVTIRPRDPTRGTDLVWSQNDMLVTVAENGGAPQPRAALALATPTIGGAICDNTIKGQLLLLSDFSADVNDPVRMGQSSSTVGGGAYLTIRGNHISRVSSRYEPRAPQLKAFGSLNVTDNTVAETFNTLIAEAITLDSNQFLTTVAPESGPLGIAVGVSMTAVGNQAVNPTARWIGVMNNPISAGNALVVLGNSGSYPNRLDANAPWYFGGVGADLL